jgi:hypothetical protein
MPDANRTPVACTNCAKSKTKCHNTVWRPPCKYVKQLLTTSRYHVAVVSRKAWYAKQDRNDVQQNSVEDYSTLPPLPQPMEPTPRRKTGRRQLALYTVGQTLIHLSRRYGVRSRKTLMKRHPHRLPDHRHSIRPPMNSPNLISTSDMKLAVMHWTCRWINSSKPAQTLFRMRTIE